MLWLGCFDLLVDDVFDVVMHAEVCPLSVRLDVKRHLESEHRLMRNPCIVEHHATQNGPKEQIQVRFLQH